MSADRKGACRGRLIIMLQIETEEALKKIQKAYSIVTYWQNVLSQAQQMNDDSLWNFMKPMHSQKYSPNTRTFANIIHKLHHK